MHLLLASTDEFMGETYIAAPGKRSRVQQLMYGRKRATDGAERGASDTRVTQMKQMWCVSASYRCTPPGTVTDPRPVTDDYGPPIDIRGTLLHRH